jgi:hypothetical protein
MYIEGGAGKSAESASLRQCQQDTRFGIAANEELKQASTRFIGKSSSNRSRGRSECTLHAAAEYSSRKAPR